MFHSCRSSLWRSFGDNPFHGVTVLQTDNNKQALSRRVQRAAMAFAPHLFIFAAVCLVALLGVLGPVNNALMDMRFRILDRAPSDTLVLVEIDPRSLREEERWPWPRDRYAAAVTNLQDAGAQLVGFDIDFSSLSDPEGDAAFMEALSRRPGEVVLPVFAQRASRIEGLGDVAITPPNTLFLRDAVVASVNLTTEKNGLVRRGWRGITDDGAFRGSMATVLAGTPGTNADEFYIDFSIDPAEIPRLSFYDVLQNDFPAGAVNGKKVIIGSTALELGDEFAAPIYGILPGVVFHALSYESIVQNRALGRLHFCIPLILAFGIIVWFLARFRHWTWRAFITTNALLFAGLISGPVLLQALAPVSLDAGVMLLAQLFCVMFALGNRINHYTRQILKQRAATAHFQALTQLVVRDSADGVIVADENGVVELCSQRAGELLGVESSIESGELLQDFADGFPLPIQNADSNVEMFLQRDSNHSEYVVGDNERTLEIVASAAGAELGDDLKNARELTVYTLRDISARKRIEEAEREAKEAALAANAVKTQLISNMSHELRTPLNGIIGFSDILHKESFGPLGADEYKEYSGMIHESGKRLSALVNDMLTVAKLDAGEYELDKQVISVEGIIECCLDDFKSSTGGAERNISTIIENDLPSVKIDVPACKDMLKRLLQNAVKFTTEDGLICMRAKRDGADFLIEVVDSGCGCDPDLLPKLKDMFYQGNGTLNRAYEGAGLGLFIVSKLASLHGGVLELHSKCGAGFLARLRFPGLVQGARTKTAA